MTDTQGNYHDFADPDRFVDPDARELTDDERWCLNTFRSLVDGGVWGIRAAARRRLPVAA